MRVLLYLPPYSPELNPIEEAFCKIKGILGKAEARTPEALLGALGPLRSRGSLRKMHGPSSSTAAMARRFNPYH